MPNISRLIDGHPHHLSLSQYPCVAGISVPISRNCGPGRLCKATRSR